MLKKHQYNAVIADMEYYIELGNLPENISKKFNYRKTHLNRRFNQIFGVTVSEYILTKKMSIDFFHFFEKNA